MAPSIADIQDELLEEIFFRLPAAADLARASTARASFRRVIANHAFLRRYHALHPPPLIGMIHEPFVPLPAQPSHPSSAAARSIAGFDFSCSSFLPSAAGRSWSPIDFLQGRSLLAGTPVNEENGRRILVGSEICGSHYQHFLVMDLAVCDPVHRRYILLPAIPDDLKALIRRPDLLKMETFLAPGDDEQDPVSFRVICLAQCKMNLLLLVFSSLDGHWHVLTYDQWGAQPTFPTLIYSENEFCHRQSVNGCFYWHLHIRNELLVLDVRVMEFSTINLTSERLELNSFAIVEAAEGMLGMLIKGYDEDGEDDRYWLTYSILRNNQWHSEKVIRLPVKRAILVGVAGGYLLMEALYTTSSHENLMFGYFSVDVKTLHVDLFAALSKPILPGLLYAGYPPSLCAPTI